MGKNKQTYIQESCLSSDPKYTHWVLYKGQNSKLIIDVNIAKKKTNLGFVAIPWKGQP